MKVILIHDVARLGRKSEIKDVPAGHAQNFLIPRGLAVPATPDHMRRLRTLMEHKEKHEAEREHSFGDTLVALKGKPVRYAAEANEQGHLFKGVKAEDIARALSAEGLVLDAADIDLPHPLKSVGSHEVPLRRGKQEGVLTLEIVKR